MSTITYPKCLQEKLDELADQVRRVEACAPLGRICDEVQAEFPNTTCCMPNVGTFTHYVTIMDSLEEAVAVIRAYRKRGIKLLHYEDRPQHHCREYYMEGLTVYASLSVADAAEGSRCQFVKVGTKTVEEPVYEVRCNGKDAK